MSSAIERIDSRPLPEAASEIRATLVARNEIVRLPRVLAHHRRLGVDRFLVVDDHSDDGSREFLLAQPDVHVFIGAGRFATQKAVWREILLTEHCQDIWTVNIDADECLVYPGMEDLDLHEFCRFLDAEGSLGLYAPMVDMYSREPLDQVQLHDDDDLLDAYPYFDTAGYNLQFRTKRMGHTVPEWQLRGGPRERVYFEERNLGLALRRIFIRWYFDIRRDERPAIARLWGVGGQLDRLARKLLPKGPPELGKIPLLRWDKALGIEQDLSGMHLLTPQIPISSCWGALLHFKHLPDYEHRVKEAVEKELYGQADDEYARYFEVLRQSQGLSYFSPSSRRFESAADLVDVGLVRSSEGLAAFIEALKLERRAASSRADA